jgi:hypothetical protein
MPSIRLDIILAALIALVISFFVYRHSLIVDGEQIKAREIEKATAEQKARDDLVAKGVVSDLNNQIASLRNSALTGVPNIPLRLCLPHPSQVPESGTAREAPTESTPPRDLRGMPPGDTGGVDIGAAVFDLAYAGAIEAAYRNATVKWAVEQGK